jgi:hypothetical protein
VTLVAAFADVEAKPSARKPRTAVDREDKAVLDNFIEKTPGSAKFGILR